MKSSFQFYLTVLCIGGLLLACQPPPPTEPDGIQIINPNFDQDITTVQTMLDAMVAGDAAGIRTAAAEGFMNYYQTVPQDSSTLDQVIEAWTVTIPDERSNQRLETVAITSVRVREGNLAGDWVMYWGDYYGTMNEGNVDIQVPFQATILMKDGKVAQWYSYYDRLAIMQVQGYELNKEEDDDGESDND